MDTLVLLIKSALDSEGMVGLKMNIPEEATQKILECLPSLRRPTIAQLTENGWRSVESIMPESEAKKIIPLVKKLGAEGIVEYPLNKIIY